MVRDSCQEDSRSFTLSAMGRLGGSSGGQFVWVAVEPGIAVRFNPDGLIDSMITTGPISTDRLRAISTQSWSLIDPATTPFHTWRQVDPPSVEEVHHVQALKNALGQVVNECLEYEDVEGRPHPRVIAYFENIKSREFDTAHDYYRALADIVRAISPMTRSVNATIAYALEINKNTAAQYVNRCRQRGYLPPSQRSKK